MRDETWRFVTWDKLEDWLLLGWHAVAHDHPYHDQFGCICIWRCNCPCVEPVK